MSATNPQFLHAVSQNVSFELSPPTFFRVRSDENMRTTISYYAILQHAQRQPAVSTVPVKCTQKHFQMTFVITSHKPCQIN